MKTRSLLVALVTAVLAALLASLVTLAPPVAQAAPSDAASSARAPSPSKDYPRMPRRCATPREKIPSKPVVCGLNRHDRDRPSIVLWGDSHSWMFIPALKEAVRGRNLNLVAVMMGSCPPMDNQVRITDAAPACFRSNALGIRVARELEAGDQPYRIVLAGSWQRYVHANKVGDRESYVGMMAKALRKGTPRLARTLRSIGSEAVVIGQVATVPERRARCPRGNDPYACDLPRSKALPEAVATRDWLRNAFRPLVGTRPAINANPVFCSSSTCRGTVDSVRTWFDDLHISATRSATLASYFAPTVDAISPVPPPAEEPGDCPLPLLC